jgi:hypothetical protein
MPIGLAPKGVHPEDARPIDPGGAHGAEASTMIGGSRLIWTPVSRERSECGVLVFVITRDLVV